jgi:hypothetical protein
MNQGERSNDPPSSRGDDTPVEIDLSDELPTFQSEARLSNRLQLSIQLEEERRKVARRRIYESLVLVAATVAGLLGNFISGSYPPWLLSLLIGVASAASGGVVGFTFGLYRSKKTEDAYTLIQKELGEGSRGERRS